MAKSTIVASVGIQKIKVTLAGQQVVKVTLAPDLDPATTERTGLVELATPDETKTGVDGERAVTPAGLSSRTATTERTGLVKKAKLAAAIAGTAGVYPDAEGVHAAFNKYGLGGTGASSETNLDLYPIGSVGIVTPASGLVSAPPGFTPRFTVTTLGNPIGSYIEQFATDRDNKRAFRFKAGTTWSQWTRIYHSQSVVGTVSQSGGAPDATSAIIERDSNSDGEWTKLIDGTMFFTRRAFVTYHSGTEFRLENQSYPQNFASSPRCTVSGSSYHSDAGFSYTEPSFFYSFFAVGSYDIRYILQNAVVGTDDEVQVDIVGIGPWY